MTGKPYQLSTSTWKTIRDQRIDLVVLPWGATEAHNYHLPYSTDNILAEHISIEAARLASQSGAGVILLPTIPFGVNTGQTDIRLDINLNPTTQLAILEDILNVLYAQRFRKFLLVNGHGGNDFKFALRELGVKYPGMLLVQANWYQSINKSEFFEEPGDHADEMETSLMMYLCPELVKPLNEAGEGRAKEFAISALNQSWAWTERKWSKVTTDTGIGNPKRSTSEKGQRAFEAITEKLGQLMADLALTPVDEVDEG